MKCKSCMYFWYRPADSGYYDRGANPYPEAFCMKTGEDLYGASPEDVENCTDYDALAVIEQIGGQEDV